MKELPVVVRGRVHITVMVGASAVFLVSDAPQSFEAGDAPVVLWDAARDVATRYLREHPDQARALYREAAATSPGARS